MHQRAGAHVDEMVVIFGGKENDIVFLKDPRISFDSFNRALAVDDQKSLGRLVVVCIGVPSPGSK